MSSLHSLTARRALVGLVTLLAACEHPTPTVVSSATMGHDHGAASVAAKIDSTTERELLALKRATAPFQDFGLAKNAGYSTQVTACFESLPLGAMGSHFGNTSLFDASLDVTKPEVLLYERKPGGGMQLVGVEFIVPFTAWTEPNPPELFGQVFVRNNQFNVWALHAWVWKTNPRGVFADWNPDVHC